jgi:hypothetical protein
MTVITEPGIYTIPDDVYHADPVPGGSLSHSGARLLLDAPAKFHHQRGRTQHKRVFDFGRAAHALVLGIGAPIVAVDAPDWRTNKAKDARDAARAAGHTPLLAFEFAIVEEMAAQLRRHPIAAALLAVGTAEQSMFWIDPVTGVWLRSRLDWLPAATARRTIIPDYKTAADASTATFSRAVAQFGYHQQAAWYLDGHRTLTGSDAAFVFIVQERDAPYLVNVCELDSQALEIGAARNRRAIDLYRECAVTGRWPGYGDEVNLVSVPRWAQIEHEQSIDQMKEESW